MAGRPQLLEGWAAGMPCTTCSLAGAHLQHQQLNARAAYGIMLAVCTFGDIHAGASAALLMHTCSINSRTVRASYGIMLAVCTISDIRRSKRSLAGSYLHTCSFNNQLAEKHLSDMLAVCMAYLLGGWAPSSLTACAALSAEFVNIVAAASRGRITESTETSNQPVQLH